ncbi:MAG: hypothetical protein JXQ90_17540 [Cyclobacteriaceae bacterium]
MRSFVEEVDQLFNEFSEIHKAIQNIEQEFASQLQKVHSSNHYNALNLLRYLRLRTFDLRGLQHRLANLGLSSLGHSERQVLANVENVLYILAALSNRSFKGTYPQGEHPVNLEMSQEMLAQNTFDLFGWKDNNVMVTLSTGYDKDQLVRLLNQGMTVARINTARAERDSVTLMIDQLIAAIEQTKKPCKIYMDLEGPKVRVNKLWSSKRGLDATKSKRLFPGDHIHWCKSTADATASKEPYFLATHFPSDIKTGSSIVFDDGNMIASVKQLYTDGMLLEIEQTSVKGERVRLGKGVNLPDTELNLPVLSDEDINLLTQFGDKMDIVGLSFCRSRHDVKKLLNILEELGLQDIGVVIKVENEMAFRNLPSIMLTAMQYPEVGVMTARGDLAAEIGLERLAEVQEEILWLTEAAIIPNIWATQVLESMSKKGVATRAEVTDAVVGMRAECIMLNKGPYVERSLALLQNIRKRMSTHQHKKLHTLRSLGVAKTFFQEETVPKTPTGQTLGTH